MTARTSITVAGLPGWLVRAAERRWDVPVLVVHGSFSHHEHFGNYLDFFASEGFDAYAVSLRGRLGVSPERADGVRFEHYLKDLVRILEELRAQPVVIGHSLGGLLALKVAELGRCTAAVLLNPAPVGMLTAQLRSLPYFVPLLPSIIRGIPFQPSHQAFRQLAFNKLSATDLDEGLRTMVAESGLVFQQMMSGAIRVRRSDIGCPVLCVGGTEDRVISRRLLRLTARRTGADLQEYPGHAHWIHAEPGWEAVAHGLLAWIRNRLGAFLPVSAVVDNACNEPLQPTSGAGDSALS
jgi:alpha-beta hydrolase superfamily lysophospholipase